MSERLLTDEQLTDLVVIASRGGERGRFTAVEAVHELRERRAADLSSEDLEQLNYAKAMLRESVRGCTQHPDYVARAVAAIDKVLAAHGAKP